jgi:2-acylglycerol O-acyltransferase 2
VYGGSKRHISMPLRIQSDIYSAVVSSIKDREKEIFMKLRASLTPEKAESIKERFLEFLAATWYVSFMWFCFFFWMFCLYFTLFSALNLNFQPLILLSLYLFHSKIFNLHESGGYPNLWFRKSSVWTYFRKYFPMKIQRKTDSSTASSITHAGPILIGYHPHGLTSCGAVATFCPKYQELSQIFPNQEFRGCTLDFNYSVPFLREVFLSMGGISVSENSIKSAISRGLSPVVVLGGASEAVRAKPGFHDLVLKKRYGFFRIAIQTGTPILPVYSFGENEIFDQADPNWLQNLNKLFIKWFGFFIPVYFGTGILFDRGLLFNPIPKRQPIFTIIGDLIEVKKIDNPTIEDIARLKIQYLAEIESIFDKFANVYSPKRKSDLRIVE